MSFKLLFIQVRFKMLQGILVNFSSCFKEKLLSWDVREWQYHRCTFTIYCTTAMLFVINSRVKGNDNNGAIYIKLQLAIED